MVRGSVCHDFSAEDFVALVIPGFSSEGRGGVRWQRFFRVDGIEADVRIQRYCSQDPWNPRACTRRRWVALVPPDRDPRSKEGILIDNHHYQWKSEVFVHCRENIVEIRSSGSMDEADLIKSRCAG